MNNKKTARMAGMLYLVIIVTGIFDLMVIPNKLIVTGDAEATFRKLMASQVLFRLGIGIGIFSNLLWLLLPLTLYRLLKVVNQTHALLMVILAEIIVPIAFAGILNKFDVLTLISNAGYLKVFPADQLHAQVLLHLQYYDSGNQLAEIFWGLWLLPFGYLVFKSGFLPRFLGLVLMVGGVGYLVDFIGGFFFPAYGSTGISTYIIMPAGLGEIAICLWLLIPGVKDRPASSREKSSSAPSPTLRPNN